MEAQMMIPKSSTAGIVYCPGSRELTGGITIS